MHFLCVCECERNLYFKTDFRSNINTLPSIHSIGQLSLTTQILGNRQPTSPIFQHGFPREVSQEKLHHGSNELGRDSVTPRPLLGLSEPCRSNPGFYSDFSFGDSKEIAKIEIVHSISI